MASGRELTNQTVLEWISWSSYLARKSIVLNSANISLSPMRITLSYQRQIALCKKKDHRKMRGTLFFGGINFSISKKSQKNRLLFFAGFYLPQCFMRVSPIAEGVGDTAMPASSKALILSSADPEFPETIAPAWPLLLPLGAVRPAMNAATGFLQFSFSYAAAFCSPPPFYVYAKLLIGLY